MILQKAMLIFPLELFLRIVEKSASPFSAPPASCVLNTCAKALGTRSSIATLRSAGIVFVLTILDLFPNFELLTSVKTVERKAERLNLKTID